MIFLFLFFFQNVQADCLYEFAPNDLTITWTAYKLPEKAGVKGSFKNVKLTGALKGKNMAEVLGQVKASIDSQSVETGDAARDAKIARHFFKSMKGSGLKGQFKILSGTNSGESELQIEMNGKKGYVPMSYSLSGEDTLRAEGVLNILAFGAMKQLAALNKACAAKHKRGYTWADVKLLVEAKFKKTCK